MTMELIIDTDALHRAMAGGPEILAKHLDRVISRGVQVIARTARGDAPKATSQLTNAIQPVSVSPFEGEVVVGADYSVMVEEGTGTHGPEKQASGRMPPVNQIRDWVKDKHLVPNDPTMSPANLAFVIARSIAEGGTRKQPYLGPAFEVHKDAIAREIDAAIDAAIEEMGG